MHNLREAQASGQALKMAQGSSEKSRLVPAPDKTIWFTVKQFFRFRALKSRRTTCFEKNN